jgi:hypothetical protein
MPKAGLKFVSPPAAVLSFVAPSVVTRGSRQDRALMRSGMGRAKGRGWRQGERQRACADRPCARAGGQEGRRSAVAPAQYTTGYLGRVARGTCRPARAAYRFMERASRRRLRAAANAPEPTAV